MANSVIFPPHYTPSTRDDDEDANLECNVFPARHATFQEPIDSVEPRDFDDDTIFDQYFRFPSPSSSPSTDDTAGEISRAMLTSARRCPSRVSPDLHVETLKSPTLGAAPVIEMARGEDDPSMWRTSLAFDCE